jgi:hypothetical protein
MISIERCKEILGNNLPDSEVERLRETLYALVENVLDEYIATSDSMKSVCKNQLSIAEYLPNGKKQKDMA